MKKQNYLVLAAALLGAAFIVPVAHAQNFRGHRGKPAMHQRAQAERMAEYLGLTDAQKEQFKQLRRAHRDAMEALHDNENLTRKQYREQMTALRKTFQEQRRALLTPEQQKKADEMREKMQERRGRGDGRGPRDTYG